MTEDRLSSLVEYAHRVATRYARRYDPEYCSIAHHALLRAIQTFDEGRNVPLEGWVSFMVKRALQYHWRRNKRYKQLGCTFWGGIAERRDEPSVAWEVLEQLNEFDRAVAFDHWVEGMTVKQVALKYGCSPKRLGTYMGKLRARLWALREELS